MGWIKNRIDTEFKKHNRLNWSEIAEAKIKAQLKEMLREEYKLDPQGLYYKMLKILEVS